MTLTTGSSGRALDLHWQPSATQPGGHRGLWLQAVEQFEEVVAVEPRNAAAWQMLAGLHEALGASGSAQHARGRVHELSSAEN